MGVVVDIEDLLAVSVRLAIVLGRRKEDWKFRMIESLSAMRMGSIVQYKVLP